MPALENERLIDEHSQPAEREGFEPPMDETAHTGFETGTYGRNRPRNKGSECGGNGKGNEFSLACNLWVLALGEVGARLYARRLHGLRELVCSLGEFDLVWRQDGLGNRVTHDHGGDVRRDPGGIG